MPMLFELFSNRFDCDYGEPRSPGRMRLSVTERARRGRFLGNLYDVGMTASGHFQTSADATAMSAFLPLATTERTSPEVRFVPNSEVRRCNREICFARVSRHRQISRSGPVREESTLKPTGSKKSLALRMYQVNAGDLR
jgi:hypothetical protein